MPKTDIRYDDRLMLKLESSLHRQIKAYAKREGVSTSEAIREAIRRMVWAAESAIKTGEYWERLRDAETDTQERGP